MRLFLLTSLAILAALRSRRRRPTRRTPPRSSTTTGVPRKPSSSGRPTPRARCRTSARTISRGSSRPPSSGTPRTARSSSESAATRFTFTVDTRVVVVDGEPVMLQTPVLYDAGFVMIPMEFVIEVAAPYTRERARVGPGEADALRRAGRVQRLEARFHDHCGPLDGDDRARASRSSITSTPTHRGSSVSRSTAGGSTRRRSPSGSPAGCSTRCGSSRRTATSFSTSTSRSTPSGSGSRREESPARIHVVLEKGDLPEIPEPDFAGRRTGGDRRLARRRNPSVSRSGRW